MLPNRHLLLAFDSDTPGAAERHARIDALVAAERWAELALPSPAEALATLQAGLPLKVNEHTVVYDPGNGLTWYTNPYGQDGVFGRRPALEQVRRFL